MPNSKLFTFAGDENHVLLIAGISVIGNGTGLFLFDGEQIQKIDNLPTAGICLAGQDRLARVFCSDADPGSPGELLVYDTVGIERYVRLVGMADMHDIGWDGEALVCVATGENKIVWLSELGEVKRTWNAPGKNDAWHLNGVCFRDGKAYCSAFGIFAHHREWDLSEFSHSGIVYGLDTGKIEVGGLDCPHNPTLLEEGWIICNSAKFEILNLDGSSCELRRSLQLDGWTRGFAYSDNYYFVGTSANRKKLTVGASASLCIIDRKNWTLCDRFAFPVTEITCAALVPKRFVPALRRAFRTNPFRESAFHMSDLFRNTGNEPVYFLTTMDPLPKEALRVRIQARVPENVAAASTFRVAVTMENLGTGVLASTPPCPVYLSYAWFDSSGKRLEGEGVRTRLPRVLPPHHCLECDAKVIAPNKPGTYRLNLTLVQEFIGWFNAVDLDSQYTATVTVHSKNPVAGISSAIKQAVSSLRS